MHGVASSSVMVTVAEPMGVPSLSAVISTVSFIVVDAVLHRGHRGVTEVCPAVSVSDSGC